MQGIIFDRKKWLLAGIAAFIVFSAVDFLFHGVLLRALYEETKAVWRSTGELMPWMHAGSAVFSLVFAFIYTKGYEDRRDGLGQGIRFGLLTGALLSIPYLSVWYIVLPIPFQLALGWAVSTVIGCVLAGIAVGSIYKTA